MPKYQAYNRKTQAWVKYEFTKQGIRFMDVKQKQPNKPFKDVPIKGERPKIGKWSKLK